MKGDSVIHTNIVNTYIYNPFIVYTDTVRLSDYIKYDLFKEGYDPVTSYMYFRNVKDDTLHSIDETIKLEKDKINRFEIYDLLNDKTYTVELKYVEDFELKNAAYSDVKHEHWAYHDIKELTLKKIISGYPDGTYRPNNNITVREFMSILSRYICKFSNGKPTMYDYPTSLAESQWGYIETKSVISRVNNLKGFNLSNLDRFITRGEVAFLVANSIEFDDEGIKYFSDTGFTVYKDEIHKLASIGVLNGYPDNTFKPEKNITRAEIAAIFARLK